jgi:RimJ/RimL family protein N-acetyltransferase
MSEEPTEFATIEIETARLILRAPALGDAPVMAALANNAAVATMTARMPFPYSRGDAEAFVRASEEDRRLGRGIALSILDRSDGQFTGCVGLNLTCPEAAEIGYWVGMPHWGQGIATEAARALIDHAFETTRITAVVGSCRVINEASRRVLEKCGLHYVTSGLASAPARGGALPVDRFRLSRRDWESFKAWRPATVRELTRELSIAGCCS